MCSLFTSHAFSFSIFFFFKKEKKNFKYVQALLPICTIIITIIIIYVFFYYYEYLCPCSGGKEGSRRAGGGQQAVPAGHPPSPAPGRFCFRGGSVAGHQQCFSGSQAMASLPPTHILSKKPRAHLRKPQNGVTCGSVATTPRCDLFQERPDNRARRQHPLGSALWLTPLPAPARSRGKERRGTVLRPPQGLRAAEPGPASPGQGVQRNRRGLRQRGEEGGPRPWPAPALSGHRGIPLPGGPGRQLALPLPPIPPGRARVCVQVADILSLLKKNNKKNYKSC